MGSEGLDGPFTGVATVDVRRNELEPSLPIFLDNVFVLIDGFVVEDLNINVVTAGLKSCYNGIVGGDAMCVLFGHKGGFQDGVGVAMIGNHDLLIAVTRSNGEAPSVVGVELAYMFNMDVQFLGHDGG